MILQPSPFVDLSIGGRAPYKQPTIVIQIGTSVLFFPYRSRGAASRGTPGETPSAVAAQPFKELLNSAGWLLAANLPGLTINEQVIFFAFEAVF